MLAVGSWALAEWGIKLDREPTDLDLICTNQEFNDSVKHLLANGWRAMKLDNPKPHIRTFICTKEGKRFILDCSIIDAKEPFMPDVILDNWSNSSNDPEFVYHGMSNVHPYLGRHISIARPDVVLMMKLSHRYKKDTKHFEKTRNDILMLKRENYGLDGVLKWMLREREEATLQQPYKLNVKKSEFFTDNVKYKYDHDSLHRAVAIGEQPAYISYLADGSEVMCSKEKFDALPFQQRLHGVLEEAYVLALERAVVPYNTDPKKAFEIALEKVCTSITSGWFREFAWENYDTIKSVYSTDYVLAFQECLEAGLILPYKGAE